MNNHNCINISDICYCLIIMGGIYFKTVVFFFVMVKNTFQLKEMSNSVPVHTWY